MNNRVIMLILVTVLILSGCSANIQENSVETDIELERLREVTDESEGTIETKKVKIEVESTKEAESTEEAETTEDAETVEDAETIEEIETVEEVETTEEAESIEEVESSEAIEESVKLDETDSSDEESEKRAPEGTKTRGEGKSRKDD